ncbi:MAG: EcoKI restriction-modification system protein HsdS [Firmicutes bacterium ADurb.Bin080]|nr:MAG: EcoKI restriction-modification system protein HsdS [Firmicutes bacterium ADurb.Bin080]
MSEWRDTTLGDICKINMGQSPKSEHYNYEKQGLPFLQGNRTFGAKYPTFDTYTNVVTKIAEPYDVIMSVRAPVGDVNITPIKMCLGRGVCSLNHNQNEQEFLYYLIRHYSKELINNQNGTVFGCVNYKDIANLKIMYPPLPEQKAIAEVLSSLDDKIDLLSRQNKTLEALASTYFRQWFIEEANDDWEEKQLNKLGKIVCGKTPSTKVTQYFGGNIPFIKIPDMHNKVYVFDANETLSEFGARSQANKTVPPFSINVSCIATVGLVTMNVYPSQTNQQINTIIPFENATRYFLFLFLKSYYEELQALGSGGTMTLNINTTLFGEITLAIPPNNLLKKFNDIVAPLFEKIHGNAKQLNTLKKLRDTLLPKLISGEVRVTV